MNKLQELISYWEVEKIKAYNKKEELLTDVCDDTNLYGIYQERYDCILLFLAQLENLK